MTNTTTIEIPKQAGERAERYEARTLYLTMGANRSQEHVAQKLGKSRQLIGRWSAEDGWAEQASNYDQTLANLAARAHAAQYQEDLKEHRERYQKAGKALYGVATQMLASLQKSQSSIEYTPAALSVIARALTTAGDLEAHALRVADLLPRLTDDSE